MILTDREISIAIERGLINIDPRPQENLFSSTSVDLTLDPVLAQFVAPSGGIDISVDPSHVDFKAEEALIKLTETVTIPVDGFTMAPKTLFLGWTRESRGAREHDRWGPPLPACPRM